MNCFECLKFDKKKGICIDKHMGAMPEYYDKPKWMGCSWYENPKENTLTLFGENYDIKTN